jgi:hypothetical protein
VLDLLKETRKIWYKPVSTPMDRKCKLNIENGKPIKDVNLFQRLMGKFIYLTVTRPDISYSISQISKFMHSPRTCHVDAIDRILRYLKGTPGKGIWFKNNDYNEILLVYNDLEVNNTINLLYKPLFMNWIFK